MGCDIHLRAESLRPDGLWEPVLEQVVTCTWCKGSGEIPAVNDRGARPCFACATPHHRGGGVVPDGDFWHVDRRPAIDIGTVYEPWYNDRDYYVFSVLADVRNDGDVQPIDDPRELPDGMHPDTREFFADDGDLHSFSWMELGEIDAYEWDREQAQWFLDRMDALREAAQGRPVRIVFAFDN